jgi:hypothetical protein
MTVFITKALRGSLVPMPGSITRNRAEEGSLEPTNASSLFGIANRRFALIVLPAF